MDRFPEAFERFEKRVDVSRIRGFDHLLVSFSHWAGKQWIGSNEQVNALKVEADKRGIPAYGERRVQFEIVRTWRFECITVKSRPQTRYRDLRTGRFIKKPL